MFNLFVKPSSKLIKSKPGGSYSSKMQSVFAFLQGSHFSECHLQICRWFKTQGLPAIVVEPVSSCGLFFASPTLRTDRDFKRASVLKASIKKSHTGEKGTLLHRWGSHYGEQYGSGSGGSGFVAKSSPSLATPWVAICFSMGSF